MTDTLQHPATLQQIVDYTARKIREQGGPSVSTLDRGACRYRGKDGRRCAIGWIIPDELYVPDMEGGDVTHPAIRRALECLGYAEDFWEVLMGVQAVHDDASASSRDGCGLFMHLFERELADCCRDHDIAYPVPEPTPAE